MTNSPITGENIHEFKTRGTPEASQDVINEERMKSLIDSILKLKKEDESGPMNSPYVEISSDKPGSGHDKSQCGQVTAAVLMMMFVFLFFGTIFVVCSTLPYINPRSNQLEFSESFYTDATILVFALIFLWLVFAFALHRVCKNAQSPDKYSKYILVRPV